MMRRTKSLIGFAAIIFSSGAIALMGFPLPSDSRPSSSPQDNSVQQEATLSASAPGSGFIQVGTGQSYLQSEADPRKRIVYKQQSQDSSNDQHKLSVYRSMQDTCKRWTRWYNKDRSANSAVQMNVACGKAAEYGRTQLNMNTKANRVDLKSIDENRPSSGSKAVLVGNKSSNNESLNCQKLRARLEHIQSRLRAGYKVREGERLKRERREVREKIRQRC